jgi:ATP-dependent DNA helicase PIF1
LVIDEVSMIDAELFDKISYVAQRVRDSSRAFGGLQLVLSGDFFQLPPVAEGARFAFQSNTWDQAVQNIVELKQVMRQGDSGFVRILNELRWGNISAASYRELIACQDSKASQVRF